MQSTEPEHCSFPACTGVARTRGLCGGHYDQFRHGKDLTPIARTIAERLDAKIDKSGSCWLWTGAISANGYGHIRIADKAVTAHRAVFELANGKLPGSVDVDHICHNRRCVRLSHLQATDRKRNSENRGVLNSNNTSGVRGVHQQSRDLKWRASVKHNGRNIVAGTFDSLADAEKAVIALRNKLFTNNLADAR